MATYIVETQEFFGTEAEARERYRELLKLSADRRNEEPPVMPPLLNPDHTNWSSGMGNGETIVLRMIEDWCGSCARVRGFTPAPKPSRK